MHYLHILSILLVLGGMAFLAAGVRLSLKVKHRVPPELQRRWSVITALLFFFLAGYLVLVLLQLNRLITYFELITGGVFFGGALFVSLVISLVRHTLDQHLNSREEVAAANERLRQQAEVRDKEIEDRRRAEEDLRESKSVLEYIFNSSIPMCITNTDFEIWMANQSYRSVFGDIESAGRPVKCYDSRPGNQCQTEECPLVRILEGEEEVVCEVSKVENDGRELHLIVTAKPFRNADGQLVGIVESFQDITERKQAEEALATEKERLAITLQSIGDGVITTDVDGRVRLINRVAQALTGWSQDEAVGLPLQEVFHIVDEKSRRPHESPVEKVLRTGRVIDLPRQTVLVAKDGWERLIADSGAPIFDRRSEVIGVVLVFRDVTDQEKLEQEIAKVEKLQSIGVLAGGIAHDFNNILTAIVGNISLAKMAVQPGDKAHTRLAKAEEAVQKAKDLTQQLLTFSKGGAPIKRVVSVGELIRDSAGFALRGSRSRCEIEVAPDLWPAEVDSGQINQVINNLVINADQAMDEGGVIRITVDNRLLEEGTLLPLESGKYIRITVSDEGRGIPRDYLPMIFDPYFTTKQAGSGLGLATVYSIINRHGGYVSVDSEVGRGTTFTMYLPATDRPLAAESLQADEDMSGHGKILVMDDNEDIRDFLGNLLRQLGYTAFFAEDGHEAIAKYQEHRTAGMPFDCLILDLTIPGGLGGKETLAQLRDLDPEVRAIVSSGYSSDPVMADYREHGFVGMVSKPYKVEELSRVLHRVCKGEREE